MISYGQTRDGRRHPCSQPIEQPKARHGVKAPISPSMVTGRHGGRSGRAVVVSGLMYGSIGDAAAVNGFSCSGLRQALYSGQATFKGASIRWADEDAR